VESVATQNPQADKKITRDDFIDEEDDPELYDAIVASLIEPAGHNGQQQDVDEDERRILKEVMQLSKLEQEKQSGKLSLDFLKRKNKPQQVQESPSQPVKLIAQPLNFQKKGAVLAPIQFSEKSTRHESLLNAQPSYGLLPMSKLDREDLGLMMEIEQISEEEPEEKKAPSAPNFNSHDSEEEMIMSTLMPAEKESPYIGLSKEKQKVLNKQSILDNLSEEWD